MQSNRKLPSISEFNIKQTVDNVLKPHLDEKGINNLVKSLNDSAEQVLQNGSVDLSTMQRDLNKIILPALGNSDLPKNVLNREKIYQDLLNLFKKYISQTDDLQRIANDATNLIIADLSRNKEDDAEQLTIWVDVCMELLPLMENTKSTDLLALQKHLYHLTETHRKLITDNAMKVYGDIMVTYLKTIKPSLPKSEKDSKHIELKDESTRKESLLEDEFREYLKESLMPMSEAWAGLRKNSLLLLDNACLSKNPEFIYSMLVLYGFNEEYMSSHIVQQMDALLDSYIKDKPKESLKYVLNDQIYIKTLTSLFNPLPISIGSKLPTYTRELLEKELATSKIDGLEHASVSSIASTFFASTQSRTKKEEDISVTQSKRLG